MEFNRCYACMGELNTVGGVCPHCGFDNTAGAAAQPEHALPCGAVLAGHYLVGRVIGQGGFGITYMAWNLALEQRVCIKEYFPAGAAVRSQNRDGIVLWGSGEAAEKLKQRRESFVREARKAARLSDLNSIVKVWDVFYENETAYIVMNYIAGENLKSWLVRRGKPIDEKTCIALLGPVMQDLEQVHLRGIVHRDIKPDNLMLQPGGKLVLLDLGAAKDLSGGSGQSSFMVASQGFSPLEQYNRNGNIGAWTDVYSMCATIYYCVLGRLLPTPTERMSGEEIDYRGLSPVMKNALERGLAVRPEERLQSMDELLELFRAPEPQAPTPSQTGKADDPEETDGEREESAEAEVPPEPEKAEAVQEKRTGKARKRSGAIGAVLFGILIAAVLIVTTALWFDGADGNPTGQVLERFGKIVSTVKSPDAGQGLFEQGKAFQEAGDYAAAMNAYREAANAGNGAAMTAIGQMYKDGLGVTTDDYLAFEWFRRGADAGDSAGMFCVGWGYYYGRGVEKSWTAALEWYLKAAEAGHSYAMYLVSEMYRYGQGTSMDIEKADEWYHKAVEAGYAP